MMMMMMMIMLVVMVMMMVVVVIVVVIIVYRQFSIIYQTTILFIFYSHDRFNERCSILIILSLLNIICTDNHRTKNDILTSIRNVKEC